MLGRRRLLLLFFLLSIAVNALLGIWALLAGEFGPTEGKVLATSLLVSAAMLSVLVNGAPVQRRVLWPVPAIAALAGVASFGLFIGTIWAEADREEPVKIAFSGLVVAAAATLAGLLALVPLRSRYEPVRYLEDALLTLLAVTALWGIWLEADYSWYGRVVGVESVLVAAVTLAIPVLWRFGSQGGDKSPRPSPKARPELGEPGGNLTIGDLSSRSVISVEPSATLRKVIEHFVLGGVSFLVVQDSQSVAGVVTEHDVLRAVYDGADLDEVGAADVMSTDLVAADASSTLADAARLMIDNGIRHLLVTGPASGVLSIRDVLAAVTPNEAR